jgi:hypothetical protein
MMGLLLAAGLAAYAAAADEKAKPAEPGTLIVVDAAGKEQKLKAWKFTAGTRRLSWLAPAAAGKAPEPKGADKGEDTREAVPAGPEALEMRAEKEIKYLDGVLTLIPFDRLRSITFDNEQETITAHVATGTKEEDEETVTGSTKYKRINKLVIEAEVDKGDLGVAEVKYLGGVPRGIQAIRFPAPKPTAAPPAGRPALVISADGDQKTTHKVTDLQPLYRLENRSEKLLPTLMFKKTLRLDLGKIQKITAAASEREETSWQVTLKDGGEETLTLLTSIPLDGKKATLEGFVGRVPAGYKLFPVVSIAEVTFDAAGTEPKPEEKKDEKKDQ